MHSHTAHRIRRRRVRPHPPLSLRPLALLPALAAVAVLCTQARADDPREVRFIDSGAGTSLAGDGLRPESDVGYIQLHWALRSGVDGEQPGGAPEFRLIGRLDGEVAADSVVYYRGPHDRSFISGLEDGEHTFVVQARFAGEEDWGPESEPIVLAVKHHPLSRSFTLFAIGAFLFVAIVFVVVREAITARNPFETHGESAGRDDADTDEKRDPRDASPTGGGA